jgi:hypothetical protein
LNSLSIDGYNLWSRNTVFWEDFTTVSITNTFSSSNGRFGERRLHLQGSLG